MTSQVLMGVLVIAVGLLFLLDNLDIIDVHDALAFWPLVFIFAGVAKLLDTSMRLSPAKLKAEYNCALCALCVWETLPTAGPASSCAARCISDWFIAMSCRLGRRVPPIAPVLIHAEQGFGDTRNLPATFRWSNSAA